MDPYHYSSSSEVDDTLTWGDIGERYEIDLKPNILGAIQGFFSEITGDFDKEEYNRKLVVRHVIGHMGKIRDLPKFIRRDFPSKRGILGMDAVGGIRYTEDLLQWIKDRDTLVVWSFLADQIKLKRPRRSKLKSFEDYRKRASEFTKWCTTNQGILIKKI